MAAVGRFGCRFTLSLCGVFTAPTPGSHEKGVCLFYGEPRPPHRGGDRTAAVGCCGCCIAQGWNTNSATARRFTSDTLPPPWGRAGAANDSRSIFYIHLSAQGVCKSPHRFCNWSSRPPLAKCSFITCSHEPPMSSTVFSCTAGKRSLYSACTFSSRTR